MALKKYFSLLLVCIFFINVEGSLILSSDYQKCNISDPNFNTCALQSFGKLIHMAIEGIPSLGIEPLDPIYTSHACFHSSGGGPISMELDLWNFTTYGFSNIKILSTEGTDLKIKKVVQIKSVIPQIKIIGSYSMKGKILTIPLTGSGTTEILLNNFTMNQQTFHHPVKRNGKTYLTIRNITLDAVASSGNVLYHSAVEGGRTLGLSDDDINNALNQNFMAIYEEYAATVNEVVVSWISPRMVRFSNEVPFEDILVK